MKNHAVVTLLLTLAVAVPAWGQSNTQPTIPRGGGMFPNAPVATLKTDGQPSIPRGGGMFPNVPVVTLKKPPQQPEGPRPDRPDHWPIIIVSPGWHQPGTATNDPRWQAVQRALRGASGFAVNWVSGNSAGQVTPVAERFVSGMNCRDLHQSVTTLGNTQTGMSTYCITPAGEWMLVGS